MNDYREALQFAAKAHDGQFRKGTNIPYIVHPFEVSQILLKEELSDEVLCVGLLHDILEDTKTSAKELELVFGKRILDFVLEHTEDKSLSWEARKKHTILILKEGMTPTGMLVSCADKLSNLRSIYCDHKAVGEDIWNRFKRGREKQSWYYGGVLQSLESLKEYAMYQELLDLHKLVFENKE